MELKEKNTSLSSKLKRVFNSLNKEKAWFRLFAILFLIFGLLAGLNLVEQRQLFRKRAQAFTADLQMSVTSNDCTEGASSVSCQRNDLFDVDVILSTGGQNIIGTDVILTFDQSRLLVSGVQVYPQNTNNVFKTFAPVTSLGGFDESKVIDTANSTGRVEFGAVSFDWSAGTLQGSFNGTINPLAKITFAVKPSSPFGTSQIKYVFDSRGATTDSNVVLLPPTGSSTVEDILDTPSDIVTVDVGSGATATATPTGAACNTCYNFNGVGKVDVGDIIYVASLWNTTVTPETQIYNVYCYDNIINVIDIQTVANQWNTDSCTP